MNVYTDIDHLPDFVNAVVTFGSFDGVHLGHAQLLQKITALAEKEKGDAVVVTFHPHPRKILFPGESNLKLLTTLDEKLDRLLRHGINHVVLVPFTEAFSQQSPIDYINNFILKCFRPRILVVGYDHRFGKDRKGDYDLLKSFESTGNFRLVKIEKEEIDEITISSTKIRRYLTGGHISEANRALGYNYACEGMVVRGDGLGKNLGYPTANLVVQDPDKLIPAEGVYAARIHVNNVWFNSMAYIGRRPTITDAEALRLEVNIFDFDEDLYDKKVQLQFISYIREDKKFENLTELTQQIQADKVAVLSYFDHDESEETPLDCVIAILNYNGLDMLKKYLPHLEKSSNTYPYDIAVVDNHSSDESVSYLKKQHPEIRIIELDENFGFAGGYNKGLELLDYSIYLLLNSDVRVCKNWIDPLLNKLKVLPNLAAIQPKIRSEAEPDYFEYAGAGGGFIDYLGYPFCRGRVLHQLEKDLGQYDDAIEVMWTSGAAMAIRSEAFWQVGGFDPDYFAHQEEIDLCLRLYRVGYLSMVEPKSVVYHVGGGTLSYESPRKTFLNFRNNLATLVKNLSLPKLMAILPVRLILDGAACLHFLVQGRWKNTLAIVRAHFAFYRSFPALIRKRSLFNKRFKNRRKDLSLFPKSILWSFYIKGNKKFIDLQND